jgi:uncharacterized protein YjbI with pentapeptide repeats
MTGADLSVADLSYGTLTNANMTGADLTAANLSYSTLTNANLTNATVMATDFNYTSLTSSQCYSTASYQTGNLEGIGLAYDNLNGWNFSGQDLSHAELPHSTLTNANLAGANLSYADLSYGTLTNTNLAGANLYYEDLVSCTLRNANLAGANLSYADLLYGTLTNASLTGANLSYANFGGTQTNANLTGADLRGAKGFSGSPITTNTIFPDGTVYGLTLNQTNSTLLVRNYSGNIPIHVQQNMTLTPSASLVLELDGNPWGSTISFDSGIRVTLGGDLELDLAAGVNAANLVGDTFQVFDWTGVNPSGQFASVTNDLPTGYSWDASQLYTTGNVTLVPESSTFVLFIAGATGLAGFRLRRRRKRRGTN